MARVTCKCPMGQLSISPFSVMNSTKGKLMSHGREAGQQDRILITGAMKLPAILLLRDSNVQEKVGLGLDHGT